MTQPTQPRADDLDRLLTPLRVAVGLLAIMILTVGIGGGLLIRSLHANDIAIERARAQARMTTCLRDNELRVDAITAARNKAADLIKASRAASGGRAPTAAETAIQDAYITSQGEATAAAYPHRDCTPSGIEAFYENPPPADHEPCQPDHKGLCQ